MKSILLSIKPKYVELIASGEKTIEVRKTRPKIETPFKCYIYCTKENKHYDLYIKEPKAREDYGVIDRLRAGQEEVIKTIDGYKTFIAHGKVIGEFVCDRITALYNVATTSWDLLYGNIHDHAKNLVRKACLTEKEIHDYAKGKDCYGWHISDLKIYDKPKELSEFYPIKPKRVEKWVNKDDCVFCKHHKWIGSMKEYVGKGIPMQEKCLLNKPEPICEYTPPLERPPQSWCYVESLGE